MLLPARAAAQVDKPISYMAHDSLVMLGNGTAFLHGQGQLKYDQMELTAEFIRMNLDSSQLYAKGIRDTVEDEWVGKPVFQDGQSEYESDELTYNLKSQKGFIRGVTTEQGEGYILSDKTKKHPEDVLTMADGKYTTCDDHDHPHFYLKMTKAKVKPGSYIATGPAYLVVGDVPTPLALPFGFFPFTSSYSSGLIMPQYGDDQQRGLYLRGLGYYFAISDYCDLEVTGDIYTKGTWALQAKSRYTWRYHFNGSLAINYREDVTGEKDMPNYGKSTNFQLQWTHSQDGKANPYSNFSASVNFSTSGYNRSNINSYYDVQQNSENTKSSTINYTQRFPNSPWSISASMSINQRTRDSTISLTLPDISVSMSSISPFQRKNRIGKEKWYEKIKMNYQANGRIAVNSIKENRLFHSDFLREWQTGMKHSSTIQASFTAFKYLNISPSISLTDRMYFTRNEYNWNEAENKLDTTISKGFYNVFDCNVSLSMSTKIYGFFIPSRKLFPNSKVDRFRHVLTPTLSVNYRPDFGASMWGYYGTYEMPYIDRETGETRYSTQSYSKYQKGIYGTPEKGRQAAISFSLAQNLEVKVVNRKDTTGKDPWKVISLIDNFSVSGGYNFVADSMNWSNFAVNLRIKLPKALNYTINLSTTLDPYMYQLNELGTPMRTNKQYWHNGKFPHWSGTSASFSYTFNNQTFKKWFGKRDSTATVEDGYIKTEIPWSLSINYSIAYRAIGGFDYEKMYPKMGITNNLSFSGSIGFGKGWKLSASTAFDFKAKTFTTTNFNVSRDLHCWSMSASFVPFGPYKNYTFHIGVNASMLADLKYDKSSTSGSRRQVKWL